MDRWRLLKLPIPLEKDVSISKLYYLVRNSLHIF
jgi:hypothetical protein